MEAAAERRAARRVPPAGTEWADRAILRPGQDVTVLNIGAGGVLVSTATAIRPGRRVDLQLAGHAGKVMMAGRVVRCQLVSLRPPTYQAAIAFDAALVADG
jgi:hypothetical protein